MSRKFLLSIFLVAVACGVPKVFAGPITHFTYVETGGFIYPEIHSSTSGTAVNASQSDSGVYSFSSAPDSAKSVARSAAAVSSLGTGELKAQSSVSFGPWLTSSQVPVGHNVSSARSTAVFGDSFRTYQGTSPFVWGSETEAIFNFDLTGSISTSANFTEPEEISWEWPSSQPLNRLSGTLELRIMAPGTLDYMWQFLHFNVDNYEDDDAGYAAGDALYAAYEASTLSVHRWSLGALSIYDHDTNTVIPTFPTQISHSLNPGSDFDWYLMFVTDISIDNSLENAFATMDFFNTASVSYSGPQGTQTYSASGLFPGSFDLQDAPAPEPIPEPATFALIAIGGLALVAWRRR